MSRQSIDRTGLWLGIALAGAFAFCVFGAYMSVKTRADFRERCEQRGGVPFTPRGDWVCLRRPEVAR